jgi:hypothetical protein
MVCNAIIQRCQYYPVVSGDLEMSVKSGETIKIKALVSDPDGDKMDVKWWYFPVITYQGVLQAVDNGIPTLTKYLRTVITVL